MEDFFKIGVITGSHGVRGEVKIYPTTDDPNRFKKLKKIYLEGKDGFTEMAVESVRVLSMDKVLVKLEGINAPEEVVKYRQRALYIDREHAVRLNKDEYFVADLMGVTVFDENDEKLGVLDNVIHTGANDVYEIKMVDGRDLLLPAIKECILDVNIEDNYMKVHVLPGLLD